jgi:FG-GAP-like repeat
MRSSRSLCAIALMLTMVACGGGGEEHAAPVPASAPTPPEPERQALTTSSGPILMVAQAQFVEQTGPDGKTQSVPGPARLTIVEQTPNGWHPVVLEDGDSNVFHKALLEPDGILTIGANQALLRSWKFADGKWTATTHWNPKFGGRFDRLRDIEKGDVDGDGKDEYVIATHDQGVIAVVHPDENWRVEEVDHQPDTFVHEIEIGDIDGDGVAEFFATPSEPNKLDKEQPGEVRMYKHTPDGWKKTIVDAPGDTHAKEILTADVDKDGVAELYAVWEGAIGEGGKLVRPVTIKQYRWKDGKFVSSVVTTIPDRQTRAITAGDLTGDGKVDIVAGSLSSGLWLIEQDGDGWKRTLIDEHSSGFEHPVHIADLDGEPGLELYVASEDQQELRRYRYRDGTWEKTVVIPLRKGDITWNITSGTR